MACFGGGSDASSQMRHDEMARQNRIKVGMAQLNAIYGGGAYGINPIGAHDYKPGGTYYNASGNPYAFDPTETATAQWLKAQGYSADKGGNYSMHGFAQMTPQQVGNLYAQHLAKTGQLFSGTQSEKGFTPEFYQQRAQDYSAYALPQLQQQYAQQQNNLAFGLADRGILNSTAAAGERGRLGQEYTTQVGNIANEGVAESQALRKQVEDNRAQMVGLLQASGDPASTAQLALASAQGFQAPSAMQPVGNFFQNFANTYGAYQQAQAYQPYLNFYNQQYNQTPGSSIGPSYSIRR